MRAAQIILNLLLAIPLCVIGAIHLFSPDVPAEASVEGTIVVTTLLLTAVILVYAIFRPFSGGLLILLCALAFAIVLNGFHASEYLLKARTVGYHPLWSGLTVLLAALGLFSLVRARSGKAGLWRDRA
jgi:hypothetical protein